MTEDFIPDQTPDPQTPHPANTPSEPNRVPLKILVISTPKVVNNTIHTFYRLGYAEVSELINCRPNPLTPFPTREGGTGGWLLPLRPP